MPVMTAADPVPPADASPAIDWGRRLSEHEAWLRRVILARTSEPQAVEEVWQQVALAAIEQRWPLTDASKVAPWLHRLAVIAAARYCRQAGRRRRASERLAALASVNGSPAAGDPLALLMRRERLALTRQAALAPTEPAAEEKK